MEMKSIKKFTQSSYSNMRFYIIESIILLLILSQPKKVSEICDFLILRHLDGTDYNWGLALFFVFVDVFIALCIYYKRNRYYSPQIISLFFCVLVCYVYFRVPCFTSVFDFEIIGWHIAYLDILMAAWVGLIIVACRNCYLISKKEKQKNDEEKKDSKETIQNKESRSLVDNEIILDLPITTDENDYLNFYDKAKYIANRIINFNSKESISIGIQGRWGEGKTSLLNLVKYALNKKEYKYIEIDFNPRQSKNPSSIQKDFFAVLLDKLEPYCFNMGLMINRYLSGIGLETGAWYTRLLAKLFFRSPYSKDALNKVFDVLPCKVIVFVDDLDRLIAEEILEVLKLIRYNSDFKNVIFITCYDKEYLNNVFSTYMHFDNEHYIEKYFTVEENVPIRPDYKYTDWLYQQILQGTNSKDEDKSILAVFKDNFFIIGSRIHTMRDVKRFYNQFIADYNAIKTEVLFRDYFLLSIIKFKNRGEFDKLYKKEYIERGGNPLTKRGVIGFYVIKNEYSEWDLSKPSDIKHNEVVMPESIDIIRKLFPDINQNKTSSDDYNSIKKISAFDRYFVNRLTEGISNEELDSLYNLDYSEITEKLSFWNKYYLGKFVDEYLSFKSFSNIRNREGIQDVECLKKHLFICGYQSSHSDQSSYTLVYYVLGMLNKKDVGFLENYNFSFEDYKTFLKELFSGNFHDCFTYKLNMEILLGLFEPPQLISFESIISLDEMKECSLAMLNNYITRNPNMDELLLVFDCCIKYKEGDILTYMDEAKEIVKAQIEKNPNIILENAIRIFYDKSSKYYTVRCDEHIHRIYNVDKEHDEFEEFLNRQEENGTHRLDDLKKLWEMFKKHNFTAIHIKNKPGLNDSDIIQYMYEKFLRNEPYNLLPNFG
jgi:hypothetical protein